MSSNSGFRFKLVPSDELPSSTTSTTTVVVPKVTEPLPFPAPVNQVNLLQHELDRLNENRTSLSTDEQWLQYRQIFTKFFAQQTRQGTSSSDQIVGPPPKSTSRFVTYLAKSYQPKAEKIIQHIDALLSSQTKWKIDEDDGRITYNGEDTGTNIVDLLRVLIGRATTNTVGVLSVKQFITDFAIPNALLGKSVVVKMRAAPPPPMRRLPATRRSMERELVRQRHHVDEALGKLGKKKRKQTTPEQTQGIKKRNKQVTPESAASSSPEHEQFVTPPLTQRQREALTQWKSYIESKGTVAPRKGRQPSIEDW